MLERHLPGVADAPAAADLRHLLVGAFLRVTPGMRDDRAAQESFWAEVDEVMAPVLFHPHAEAVAASVATDAHDVARIGPLDHGRRADPLGGAGDRPAGTGRGQSVRRCRAVG